MDVLVRLSLQGGHKWEFCCKEDDPILIGLLSALPGADSNLPADGLIQVETRTGERLFLTRSSLVSMAIVPVTDPSQLLDKNYLVTSPTAQSEAAKPAPFVMVPDALPPDVHQALTAHALADGPAEDQENGIRKLRLGPLQEPVVRALRRHIDKSIVELGISVAPETLVQLGLFAIGNGGSISCKTEPADTVCLVYHLHKHPKPFTGGGIRLFDSNIKGDVSGPAAFRDIDISDNAALIFPGGVVTAGLPVYCTSGDFRDSLFVLCGTLEPPRG